MSNRNAQDGKLKDKSAMRDLFYLVRATDGEDGPLSKWAPSQFEALFEGLSYRARCGAVDILAQMKSPAVHDVENC